MSDTELMLMVESRKKSRLVAILLNIFLPGAGYMYCGRWILGVVAFFFVILLVVVSLGFAAIGLYVVLIIDAALCVGRYNRRMTEDLIKSRVRAHRGTDVAEAGHPLGIESKPVSRINTAILYVFGALALVFLYAAASLFVEKSGTSFSALELQSTFASDGAEANQDKQKQEWIQEAQAAGKEIFDGYHAVCNGRVIVRAGSNRYYEFSGSRAEVLVLGLYDIEESDRLNGKLWSGKLYVSIGESARMIDLAAGGRKVSEWTYGREPEFDLIFDGGKWKLNGEIFSYTTYNFALKPNVSCSAAGM